MSRLEIGSKDQVNFLKGLAILAVLGIHIINTYVGNVKKWSPGFDLMVVLDQVFRFCVPMFVALSGFALAKKYLGSKLDLKDFYLHRAAKLLPLYFLWTFVYFVGGKLLYGWDNNFGNFLFWVKTLVNGWGQYHLYFVPMIFQAYLVFPLLFWLIKKNPWVMMGISVILQILIFSWINAPGWNDQAQYARFWTWQIYFVLGIFLAFINIGKIKSLFGWVSLVGLILTVYIAFTDLAAGGNLIWVTRFTRWPVVIYALAMLIFVLSGKDGWHLPDKISNTIITWGRNSYLIYLSHVLLLQLISVKAITLGVGGAALLGLAAVLFSVKLKI